MTRGSRNNLDSGVVQCWIAYALVLLQAASAAADERPEGLMWNRSGLPATLPLQIKTNSGSDYLLHLRETSSGQSVLAAYIRGGEFFRVFVPPGRFDLLFVAGTEWQGEAEQFGPASNRFVLGPPLTFRATASRKNGYLVDLRDTANITIRDWAICQRLEFEPKPPFRRPHHWSEEPILRPEPHRYIQLYSYQYYPWRYEVRSRFCE